MKIYPDKLVGQMAKGLAPVYLVAGDEPLQVEESVSEIRAATRKAGFEERELFFVERGFNWNDFYAASSSLSLFSSRKLIELRLPGGKPGDAGAKAIKEYCEDLPQDVVLVVISPKVDQRASWVKALDKAGVFVTIWPVDVKRLPQWIIQRLQSRGLRADREVAQLIAERVEGNLLAAAQEIEKLLLLHGPGELDVEAARRAVTDSARFDVFRLVDAALAGDSRRVVRSLIGLRAEGVEAVLVLWAVAREVRDLARRSASQASGKSAMAGVWEKRKDVVAKGLARHTQQEWMLYLQRAARIDRVIKGLRHGDSWRELADLLLDIAGGDINSRVA